MTLVVHPHFHGRRTGITRHVESVVSALAPHVEARVTGRALPASLPAVTRGEVWRRARRETVIWHAHRNNEALAGLLMRALGARLRVVVTRHASHPPSLPTRLLLGRADRTVALTPEIAAVVERATGRRPDVVAHGVDIARFSPPADRDAAWAALGAGGRRGVGVVGRIRPAKGQGTFAGALAPLLGAHPDWRAVLVGAALGADAAWAESLRERCAGALLLTGEQADPVPWYRGLAVLVQPSPAEGLSLALLEGLACGCCVVAARLPQYAPFLEHGRTGFYFEPGDEAGLRRVLERLLSQPELAAQVGRAAAAEARARFGVEHEAAALAKLYRELAGA